MTITLTTKLDHPAYHHAIRLPKYNGPVNVIQATCSVDAAQVLRRANPDWTPADHLTLADLHATEAARQLLQYNTLLDAAATETFGRPFQPTDYRISAIGSDAFSAEKKHALRHAAHARTNHRTIASAHLKAAGRRTNHL